MKWFVLIVLAILCGCITTQDLERTCNYSKINATLTCNATANLTCPLINYSQLTCPQANVSCPAANLTCPACPTPFCPLPVCPQANLTCPASNLTCPRCEEFDYMRCGPSYYNYTYWNPDINVTNEFYNCSSASARNCSE